MFAASCAADRSTASTGSARGLALWHLDSVLKQSGDAERYRVDDALVSLGIDAFRAAES